MRCPRTADWALTNPDFLNWATGSVHPGLCLSGPGEQPTTLVQRNILIFQSALERLLLRESTWFLLALSERLLCEEAPSLSSYLSFVPIRLWATFSMIVRKRTVCALKMHSAALRNKSSSTWMPSVGLVAWLWSMLWNVILGQTNQHRVLAKSSTIYSYLCVNN